MSNSWSIDTAGSEFDGLWLQVPVYLRNLLILNGFDSAVSLRSFIEDDFFSLEKFTKEDLHKFIEKDQKLLWHL